MSNLRWSIHNSKVSKLDAVSFGIPAFKSADGFKTCPQAGACAPICYARQGTYRWPATIKAREHNLKRARECDTPAGRVGFILDANLDLKRIKACLVRIHDSGDFFNQRYLDAWKEIARQNPSKTFYAYTKSLHLDWSDLPLNFRVTQSEGGLMDHQIDRTLPHSRIFSTHYQRERAGYRDGTRTDSLAIRGATRIGLVYHGGKHLTTAQKISFNGGAR